jgi:hypothetical protein
MIEAELPDGTILEFPDNTPDSVVDSVVRQHMGVATPTPTAEPTQFREMGVSAAPDEPLGVSGAGVMMPTEAYRTGMGREFAQGVTLGGAEEAEAGLKSAFGGGTYEEELAKARGEMKQFREAEPKAAFAAEMAGSFASPIPYAKVRGAERLGKTGEAMARAGAVGFGYGFGTGEGGIIERAENAVEVAVPSMLIGGIAQKGLDKLTNKTLAAATRQGMNKPTIEALETAKNKAYAEVDKSATVFGKSDMQDLYGRVSDIAKKYDYDPKIDTKIASIQRMMENKMDMAQSLSEFDRMRQNIFRRAKGSGDETENAALREMAQAVSEVIDDKLGQSGDNIMQVARLANARYAKAKELDDAFEAARRQAAATGSGGNVENLYRQAVNRILKGKGSRFFTEAELANMQKFVEGDSIQNVARLLGKLSPNGNGLMLALNVGAVAYDPMMVAATITGMGSKKFAEKRVESQAQKLVDMAAGQVKKVQEPATRGISAPSAVTSQSLLEQLGVAP